MVGGVAGGALRRLGSICCASHQEILSCKRRSLYAWLCRGLCRTHLGRRLFFAAGGRREALLRADAHQCSARGSADAPFEKPRLSEIFAAWLPILYAGALSSGVGYTFQIIGQKGMNPTAASLILSLESVISVLAGWVILHQRSLQGNWQDARSLLRQLLSCSSPNTK